MTREEFNKLDFRLHFHATTKTEAYSVIKNDKYGIECQCTSKKTKRGYGRANKVYHYNGTKYSESEFMNDILPTI